MERAAKLGFCRPLKRLEGGILEGFCSSPGARQQAVEIDY